MNPAAATEEVAIQRWKYVKYLWHRGLPSILACVAYPYLWEMERGLVWLVAILSATVFFAVATTLLMRSGALRRESLRLASILSISALVVIAIAVETAWLVGMMAGILFGLTFATGVNDWINYQIQTREYLVRAQVDAGDTK